MRRALVFFLILIATTCALTPEALSDTSRSSKTSSKNEIFSVTHQLIYVMLTPKSSPYFWDSTPPEGSGEEVEYGYNEIAIQAAQSAIDFWQKNSDGKINFKQSLFIKGKPGTTLAVCNDQKVFMAGMQVAKLKSLKPGQHLVIANVDNKCSYSGVGDLLGNRVILKSLNTGTLAHELGHNFGFLHSSSITCKDNDFSKLSASNCKASEYWDFRDLMGNGEWCPTSTISLSQRAAVFGWPKPMEIKSGNTYTIKDSSRFKEQNIYSLTVNKLTYLFEYRVPSRNECMLVTGFSRARQIEVRIVGLAWAKKQNNSLGTLLLDRERPEVPLTTESGDPIIGFPGNVTFTGFVAGETFNIPGTSLTMQVLTTDPDNATFRVS